jgi:hypothetical protein
VSYFDVFQDSELQLDQEVWVFNASGDLPRLSIEAVEGSGT